MATKDAALTPALRLAARLRALAAHLTRYPHLAPVNVISDQLQVRWLPDAERSAALLAWAESLTEVTVDARNLKGEAFVHVSGTATAGTVTVWTTIPNLPAVLAQNAPATCVIGLDGLRAQVAADRAAEQQGGA